MTTSEAISLLVGLYNRDIDNPNFATTQRRFDFYVVDYCKAMGIFQDGITLDQLIECAKCAMDLDGFDYLHKL